MDVKFLKMIPINVILLLLIFCFFDKSSEQSVKMLNLYEGDVCQKGNGSNLDYVCKRAENCESLPKDVKNKKYPDICSFIGSIPIFCCSPTIDKIENPNIIVNERCRQYSEIAKKMVYTRGIRLTKRNTGVDKSDHDNSTTYTVAVNDIDIQNNTQFANLHFVVGGQEAVPMEFPHMALIGFGETLDDIQWGCGGSLISERWILTAAHCKQTGTMNLARWTRLGDLNIISDADNAQPKNYRIVEYMIHPDYKPPSLYHDIALFRLETEVEFSKYVRPICLNSDPLLNPHVQIATGWGKISTGEPTSDHLLKVELNAIPADLCNVSYFTNDNRKLKFGILSDSMICAGSTHGDKDTCGGDSGGPLQIRNVNYSGMFTQVGITSFGKFCGDKDSPGVYTRVSKYIPWIQSIVWPLISG